VVGGVVGGGGSCVKGCIINDELFGKGRKLKKKEGGETRKRRTGRKKESRKTINGQGDKEGRMQSRNQSATQIRREEGGRGSW